LTSIEIRKLFEDICTLIKEYISDSLIALDFSSFILNDTNEMIIWWNIFKDSKSIDLIHVSSNENELALFNSISILTGKKIILTNGNNIIIY